MTIPSKNKVLHMVASTGLYGAETVILNLSKEMLKCPFLPVVGMVVEEKGKMPEIGTAAKNLGLETAVFYSGGRFDPVCILRIFKYIKKNAIVAVHSHGYKPSILSYIPCKLLKTPLLITCHLWFNTDDNKLQLYHKLETWIMKRLPVVVGVSEEICNELIEAGVKRENTYCVYNGIDTENYRKYPMVETRSAFVEFGISDTDFVIGSIGRLHEQKAFHFLLNAINILLKQGADLKCLIFGDGPLRKELEATCAKLGLQEAVQFLGFREDILNLLELMDIFVISSIDEGLPMVLLEAMASRKAIISTSVGAIDSVLTHEKNALIYDIGDVKALAGYIDFFQNDTDKRSEFGEAAYRRFKMNFTSAVMARKYITLYKTIIR